MKITFTKYCAPCLASGWSAYEAGTKADLVRGVELVAMGVARAGWSEPAPESMPQSETVPESAPLPQKTQAKKTAKPTPKRRSGRRRSTKSDK